MWCLESWFGGVLGSAGTKVGVQAKWIYDSMVQQPYHCR